MPVSRERLRASVPVVVTFLVLLAWTTYGYLTIRIDGDMIAEALQVRQWMDAPFWVLSYPGQLHGGIVEYPLIILAQKLAPWNVYGWTFLRIFYVPIAAVLVAVSLRRAFPRVNLWWFAAAAAAGPAVLHGMVSIKDLYPFSWLLSAAGVYLVYRYLDARRRLWLVVAGGVLIGLGIYEHPTASLLSVPLVLAAATRWRVNWREVLSLGAGVIVGLVPLVLALKTQPDKHIVFMPAHVGIPDLVGALGLTTAPTSWAKALVPQGWGIQTTDLTTLAFPTGVQFVLNVILALVVVAGLVLAIPFGLRSARAEAPSPRAYLAALWGGVLLMVTLLVTVVPPVFFYGAGLSFLVFATVALVPIAWSGWPGKSIASVVVALMAVTSLGAFLYQPVKFVEAAQFKLWKVHEMRDAAQGIGATGIRYVYGDYWEILPLANESAGMLHPISVHDNRFPVVGDDAAQDTVVVAVSDGHIGLPAGLGRWPGAQEALDRVAQLCTPETSYDDRLPDGVSAYRCPVAMLNGGD